MKFKLSTILLSLLMITGILLNACNNDDDDDPAPDNKDTKTGGNYFNVTVNGNKWENIFMAIGARSRSGREIIGISGNKDNATSTSVAMSLDKSIDTGKYNIGPNPMMVMASYNINEDSTEFANSGILEVTTHNKSEQYIEGTFNFNTENHNITNGSFGGSY